MLTDGIELLGQSTATNLAIATGQDFPEASVGELFYKAGVGLHIFDGNAWTMVGATDELTAAAIEEALGFTPAALENGKIVSGQVPAIAITDTYVVNTQAAMLGLAAEIGDVAVRTDNSTTYILKAADPTVLANWVQLLNPTSDVTSVNGQTGTVTLTTTNVAEGTGQYFTSARARAAVSVSGSGGSYDQASGVITISAPSYSNFTLGSGSAGNGQVQYNANGILSGSPNLTYAPANGTLSVGTVSLATSLKFPDGSTMTSAPAAQTAITAETLTGTDLASSVVTASLGTISPATSLTVRTGASNTFAFLANGSFAVGGSSGTAGQVLTSQGNAPPTWVTPATSSGTVTSISVAPANGITGTVANPNTTPAITLTLGSITPTYVTTPGLAVSGAAGTYRSQYFSTTGSNGARWVMGADSAAETATAGSNFFLTRQYNDGTQNVVLSVARATGVVDFKAAPTVNGAALVGAPTLSSTQIGFGSGTNTLTGSYKLAWTDTTSTLNVGYANDSNLILGADHTNNNYSRFTAVVRASDTPLAVNLTVRAGNANGLGGTLTGGGTLSLMGGLGSGGYEGGPVVISTANSGTQVERLRILNTGAWSVGSTGTAYGTSGQVLQSNGNAPPSWATIGGSAASTLTGTDLATNVVNASITALKVDALKISSMSNLPVILTLSNSNGAGIIQTAQAGDLTLRSGTGADSGAGNVNIIGGQGPAQGTPGHVIITGGSAPAMNGYGGRTDIRGGTGNLGSGAVRILTAAAGSSSYTERLKIDDTGAWFVSGSAGTVGQGLVSNGPNSPPTWGASTVTAPAGTLTGNTLASNVINASIQNLTQSGTMLVTNSTGSVSWQFGNAALGQGATLQGVQGTNANAGVSFTLRGATQSGTGAGGELRLTGGTSSVNDGGDVVITGGLSSGGASKSGGNVIITGGDANNGTGTPTGGHIIFNTGLTNTALERFRITNTGAWSVGTTGTAYGTAGQVLTSAGNAPPTWSAISITSSNVTSALGFTPIDAATKGAVNGVASLDAAGKIIASQLPAIAITDTFVVNSQAAMLALTAQTGDVAVRTDLNKSFIVSGANGSAIGNWQELLTPLDAVQTVAGRTGNVVLGVSDVSGAAPLASPALSGVPTAPTAAPGTNTTQIATTAFVAAQASAVPAGNLTGDTLAFNIKKAYLLTNISPSLNIKNLDSDDGNGILVLGGFNGTASTIRAETSGPGNALNVQGGHSFNDNAPGGLLNLYGGGGTGATANGGPVYVQGGTSDHGTGGAVQIMGGITAAGVACADVTIIGGHATNYIQATDALAGAVIIKTGQNAVERMRFLGTGALSLGNTGTNIGTAGQVLTSTGNSAPTWAAPTFSGTIDGGTY